MSAMMFAGDSPISIINARAALPRRLLATWHAALRSQFINLQPCIFYTVSVGIFMDEIKLYTRAHIRDVGDE